MITALLWFATAKWPEVKRGLYYGSAIGTGWFTGEWISHTYFH